MSEEAKKEAGAEPRAKRTIIGRVVSSKMDKTVS